MIDYSREYRRWKQVKGRCHNPNHKNYNHYGARGIKLHPEWRSIPHGFIQYIESYLGPPPEGYTLDRIDNNKGYEPGNLRWASPEQQAANRRQSWLYEGYDENYERLKNALVGIPLYINQDNLGNWR